MKQLDFARSHLPDHEPWRAWANFEFIDDEGRVNGVDLLVLTPAGLVLIEIKSRPGTVTGDAHSWTWITEGRERRRCFAGKMHCPAGGIARRGAMGGVADIPIRRPADPRD